MKKKFDMGASLPSAEKLTANLFTTQAQRDGVQGEESQEIELTRIDPFPGHPYTVRNDKSMQALVNSVEDIGVRTPALVRQKEDGRFELISGHRRKQACEQVGLNTMPCFVRDMNQDEAVIIMVSSNIQRDIILYSETASACKMMLESIKRQGKRTDLTSPKLLGKLKNKEAADIVGEVFGISGEMVRHRIHLLNLIPDILDMVDAKKFSITPAFEISHLPNEAQQFLHSLIERDKRIPTLKQAKEMRKRHEESSLDNDTIGSIMHEDKTKPVKHYKVSTNDLQPFLPKEASPKDILAFIVDAVKFYHEHLSKQQ